MPRPGSKTKAKAAKVTKKAPAVAAPTPESPEQELPPEQPSAMEVTATHTAEPPQVAAKATVSFASLVSVFARDDAENWLPAVLKAIANEDPEVMDETSLWKFVTSQQQSELSDLLSNHLKPMLWMSKTSSGGFIISNRTAAKWAAVTLLDWSKTFTPPEGANNADREQTVLMELLLSKPFQTVGYDVLAYLEQHVKTGVERFHSNVKSPAAQAYKGPFSAIIQSSGMGKTRLALQLATRDHMHVIYICCRSDKTGYPPRTSVLMECINRFGLKSEFWPLFLLLIVKNYGAIPSIWDDPKVRRDWLAHVVVDDEDSRTFWDEVVKQYTKKTSARLPAVSVPETAFVVFVFDEAAALAKECPVRNTTGESTTVSVLNRIRKGLRDIGTKAKLFALFTDTNSHISNLFPADSSLYMTPSVRPPDVKAMNEPRRVLPPFCMLPMCNPGTTDHMRSDVVTYRPFGGNHSSVGDRGVTVSWCPVTLALLSRPLFAMLAHQSFQIAHTADEQSETMDEILTFAKTKLVNATDPTQIITRSDDSTDTDLARLAVLGCRYFLSSTSTLHKQLLVRQHMATCFGVSDDGQDVIVGYQSEPLLAEAAAQLMQTEGAFCKLMEALYRIAVRGSLALPSGKGEMGELVVCLALSRAFDKASARLPRTNPVSQSSATAATADDTATDSTAAAWSPLCRPIPLVEVLVELYGGSDQARGKIADLLQDNALRHGIVMFNQFVKASLDPIKSVASYKALLARGAAVLCKNGEAAKDIVIPVALPDPADPDKPIDPWDSDSFVLTTCEVQVKNWKAAFRVRNLVSSMVSTATTDTVDGGVLAIAQRDRREVTGRGKTRQGFKTTMTYPVPTLYPAVNAQADHSVDVTPGEIGTNFFFGRHWVMTADDGAAESESESESSDEEQALPEEDRVTGSLLGRRPRETDEESPMTKRRKTTHPSSSSDAVETTDATTPPVAEKLQQSQGKQVEVIGLQLCGLDAFAVFSDAERQAIERLLAVSDNPMTLLQQYHETYLGVSTEEARQRASRLLPEHQRPTANTQR